MILLFHIFSAILGIVSTIFALLVPSPTKIYISIGLSVSTLFTGLIMLITGEVSLGRFCISGIIYSFFVIMGVVYAKKRLNNFSTNPK